MTSEEKILQKISEIVEQLDNQQNHHKAMLKKYKLWHSIFSKSQIILNSISIGTGSSAAISFASGLGVTFGIVLSTITASSCGLGVFFNIMDQRLLKKIHRHYQLMVLARTLDLKLFSKHLCDGIVTAEDFQQIAKMMTDYYQRYDLIQTKSLFVGDTITHLAREYHALLNNGQNGQNNGQHKI
jgi:hypothetical protein